MKNAIGKAIEAGVLSPVLLLPEELEQAVQYARKNPGNGKLAVYYDPGYLIGRNLLPLNAWKIREILNHNGSCYFDCKKESFFLEGQCEEIRSVLRLALDIFLSTLEDAEKESPYQASQVNRDCENVATEIRNQDSRTELTEQRHTGAEENSSPRLCMIPQPTNESQVNILEVSTMNKNITEEQEQRFETLRLNAKQILKKYLEAKTAYEIALETEERAKQIALDAKEYFDEEGERVTDSRCAYRIEMKQFENEFLPALKKTYAAMGINNPVNYVYSSNFLYKYLEAKRELLQVGADFLGIAGEPQKAEDLRKAAGGYIKKEIEDALIQTVVKFAL